MKLSLFADDMIVYIENPIESAEKLLNLINEFDIIARYNVNTPKSKAFLYTNNETSEREIRKKIPFDIARRKIKKVPRNKPNQGGKTPALRNLYNTEERN